MYFFGQSTYRAVYDYKAERGWGGGLPDAVADSLPR